MVKMADADAVLRPRYEKTRHDIWATLLRDRTRKRAMYPDEWYEKMAGMRNHNLYIVAVFTSKIAPKISILTQCPIFFTKIAYEKLFFNLVSIPFPNTLS